MFEKFRKGIADAANGLPKEDRKDFLDTVSDSTAYGKAKEEHKTQIKESSVFKDEELERLANEKVVEVELPNGEKIELGPDLGYSTWNDIEKVLNKLNGKLKTDDKPWRAPTKAVCDLLIKKMLIEKEDYLGSNEYSSIPDDFKAQAKFSFSESYFESLGFKKWERYWTSTSFEGDNIEPMAYYLQTSYPGEVDTTIKDETLLLRCVR